MLHTIDDLFGSDNSPSKLSAREKQRRDRVVNLLEAATRLENLGGYEKQYDALSRRLEAWDIAHEAIPPLPPEFKAKMAEALKRTMDKFLQA